MNKKFPWFGFSLSRHTAQPALPKYPDSFLRIAVLEGGGLGDAILQLPYLKAIRKMFNKPVIIDFYTRPYKAFEQVPFIDHTFPYDPKFTAMDSYDVYMQAVRCYHILKIDKEKTEAFSPEFYHFCSDCIALTEKHFKRTQSNLFNQYAMLFGKNRMEQSDVHYVLGVDRYTPPYMTWDEKAFSILDTAGLADTPYITLCRAVDEKYGNNHPKLWPLEHYIQLIKSLKQAYPHIKLVQIGSKATPDLLEGVDINLTGQTNLEQSKVLLKYALLHIDGEGGLVHLRHALQGKSAVMFGPTSVDMFGYEDNLNFSQAVCPVPCDWISGAWMQGCMRTGHSPAPCMVAITPQRVFETIRHYLDHLPVYKLSAPVKEVALQIADKTPQQIAFIGRPQQDYQTYLAQGHQIKIYDTELNLSDTSFPKNCFYAQQVNQPNCTAEYATFYNIPAKDNTFDVVCCTQLECATHPAYALQEMLRILKPGGKLFLAADKTLPPFSMLGQRIEVTIDMISTTKIQEPVHE